MPSTTTSIRLPDDVIADLDGLARVTNRTRTYLITKAVKEFVRREAWHVGRIQQGIAQADAGDFVPDDEMEAFWNDWTGREGLEQARAEVVRELASTSRGRP